VTEKVTHGQTDRRTDEQTDDREVIPKCHFCLQQVKQQEAQDGPKSLTFYTLVSWTGILIGS